MPRQPHHHPNYGGKRPGQGRRHGSVNKFQQSCLDMAAKYKTHPVELLLMMVDDEEQPMSMRLNAAVHVLPYVAPRQASIAPTQLSELDEMDADQKTARIRALLDQIGQKRPAMLPDLRNAEPVGT